MSYIVIGYLCFGNGVFIDLLVGSWLAARNGAA
jgi:hypothetical protein